MYQSDINSKEKIDRRYQAYSVASFGQTFSVGRSTIYEEIRAGRLKVRKVGSRTLITHEDAMAWLNSLPSQANR